MDRGTRDGMLVIGVVLALLGAVVVSAVVRLPVIPASVALAAGFALVGSGVGLLILAAAVPKDVPFTRADEEAFMERIERSPRRLD